MKVLTKLPTLFLLLFLFQHLQAATWYVKTTGNDNNTGTSWQQAFQSIQYAINTAAYGDEIWVAEGTYVPTLDPYGNDYFSSTRTFYLKNGVKLFGGFVGSETLRSQRNWQTHPTVLSGLYAAPNQFAAHVVISVNDDANTEINGFTIRDGIGSFYAFLNVESTYISGDQGGGMANFNSYTTIANCTFTLNYSGVGIGMYNQNGGPTITNCTFFDNRYPGSGGFGGGIYNYYSNPTISQCAFTDNKSKGGGGIYNNYSNVNISDCQFSGNVGSGIVHENSTVQMLGCIFAGNKSGGINISGGNVTVADCWIVGNDQTNGSGAGIACSSAEATFTNCVIAGNYASNYGGGLYISSCTPTLTNCTITGNKAGGVGGGMYAIFGTFQLKNCIVWNNKVNDPNNEAYNNFFSIFGPALVVNSSLVEDVTDTSNGNLDGITTAGNAAYPQFLAPFDPNNAPSTNGDVHLSPCSPLIDAGTAAGAPGADLDGAPRLVNSGVDLGAFELQGPPQSSKTFYPDLDNDGYGAGESGMVACLQPEGYADNDLDCDDGDPVVYFGAPELCDGKDNDCNTIVDDLPNGSSGTWSTTTVGGAGGTADFPPCEQESNDVFNISATGYSTSTSDQLQVVGQVLCGNGSITARVLSVSGGGWAGICIRESLAPGAKKASLKTQLSTFVRREIRTTENGAVNSANINRPLHSWLQLVRTGSTITGYTSADGASWSFAFSATVSMANCVYIGLFAESINATTTTSVSFDHVVVSGGAQGLAVNPSAPIETPASYISAPDINVYPNPSTGKVNVQSTGFPPAQEMKIKVFNALGNCVLTKEVDTLNETSFQWDLSNLPNGMYWIQFDRTGQPLVTRRLVLTKDQ